MIGKEDVVGEECLFCDSNSCKVPGKTEQEAQAQQLRYRNNSVTKQWLLGSPLRTRCQRGIDYTWMARFRRSISVDPKVQIDEEQNEMQSARLQTASEANNIGPGRN